ncbi:MAG: hypothetical protein BMS9Abin02_0195 [Anaerolineae bacterium]|nr:MAG: hypothetical protein BMS9Abin02_0195 [Anaerolineae bacterium]
MTAIDREHLVDLLSATHSKTRAILKGIDLDIQVYDDGGWRIRDILGHIATWDRQVSLSLRAFSSGTEYAIPEFDEEAFNIEDVRRQVSLTSQQVFEEWEMARELFKDAVREIPQDRFPGDLLYPWGDERGTVVKLVKEMCDHDEEHYSEISRAIEASLET